MKTSYIIIAILAIVPIFMGGCASKPETKIVYTERQPVEEVQRNPEPTVNKEIYVSEKEPMPKSIVRHEDGTKSVEQMNYEEDKKFSEERRVTYIQEEKDLTGREITYYWVEAKLFDDADKLDNIRENIFAGCQARNYKITDEQYPSRKGFKVKIWSEMGPISLHETIRSILEDFTLHITRKDEHLVVVTPN